MSNNSKAAQRFGQMLRKMRNARGLSQLELANRAHLSENAISAFERAERFPRATTIDSLTGALHTEVDDMLADVLMLRERPTRRNGDAPRTALRELAELLKDRPEAQVQLVLEMARMTFSTFDDGRARLEAN